MRQLIIDSNGLGYAAMFKVRGLSHGNIKTNVIFGFLNQILVIARKFQSSDFVFCWDSKKSLRRMEYAMYKRSRNEKRREMTFTEREEYHDALEQFTLLRTTILPALGFGNIYLKTGYESDDVAAAVVLRKWKREQTLVSSDHDFLQLLGNGIELYDHRKGKRIDATKFKRDFGIDSYMYSTVLSIAGCSGDGVPGVEGIGIKTAIKYLNGQLNGKSKAAIRIRDFVNSQSEVHELYRRLVTLPFNGNINLVPLRKKKNSFSEEKFEREFERYDFKSFLRNKKWNDWRELFCEKVQD